MITNFFGTALTGSFDFSDIVTKLLICENELKGE